MFSECRGLGSNIKIEEARMIAERLILRYVTEIQEAIALLERYRDFERSQKMKIEDCIVHDSEGEYRIIYDKLL